MVTSFMFQEIKNTEILKEKLREAEKCSPPPQDTYFLVAATLYGMIGYDMIRLRVSRGGVYPGLPGAF